MNIQWSINLLIRDNLSIERLACTLPNTNLGGAVLFPSWGSVYNASNVYIWHPIHRTQLTPTVWNAYKFDGNLGNNPE